MPASIGLGGVALANTNHWMRGGSYGWLAAETGVFALCWTNTLANLPAWGAASPTLGNNPLVVAIPRPDRAHVVLDMAISQFSYGSISAYAARGSNCPFPVDTMRQAIDHDPAAIEISKRALPIGYWKGSGLSLVLDMLAAMLSGGHATHELPRDPLRESGLSQIFFAIDPSSFAARPELDRIANGILTRWRPHPSMPPALCDTPASRRSTCAKRTFALEFPSIQWFGRCCSRSPSRLCAQPKT